MCVYAYNSSGFVCLYVSLCKMHLWTYHEMNCQSWVIWKCDTRLCVSVCVIFCVCVCVALFKGRGDFWGQSPWEITFPFFLSSLFCSPSLCRPPLLSSFPWGTVANGILSHCRAPTNHRPSSSLVLASLTPPTPSIPSIPTVHWLAVCDACSTSW